LGVSRGGIEFGAVDGQPVHLLFIVANHPDHQMNYLRILSSLVSMVREERFREEILSCGRASEAEQKLCGAFEVLLQRHEAGKRSEATA
ncbi:MAG: PTS sugar transporter subunit IIA, partial [Spirochaetota bacterium]